MAIPIELDHEVIAPPPQTQTQSNREPPRYYGNYPTEVGDGFERFFRYEFTRSIAEFEDRRISLSELVQQGKPLLYILDTLSPTPTIRISDRIIEDMI